MPTQFLKDESQNEIVKFRPIFDKAVNEAKQIAKEAKATFYDIVEVRFYTSDEQKKDGDGGSVRQSE